tara:strand:- start:319 stop:543 length:225 start_codon:yes stop_codon:yes gene_type:complete
MYLVTSAIGKRITIQLIRPPMKIQFGLAVTKKINGIPIKDATKTQAGIKAMLIARGASLFLGSCRRFIYLPAYH